MTKIKRKPFLKGRVIGASGITSSTFKVKRKPGRPRKFPLSHYAPDLLVGGTNSKFEVDTDGTIEKLLQRNRILEAKLNHLDLFFKALELTPDSATIGNIRSIINGYSEFISK